MTRSLRSTPEPPAPAQKRARQGDDCSSMRVRTILTEMVLSSRLVAVPAAPRRFPGAAVKGRHIVQLFRLRVRLLHGGHSGFAYGFQLGLFRHGLGAGKHFCGKVKVLFIVQRHLFFNQANGQVGAVDQRGFVRLAVARQQGALRRNGAALARCPSRWLHG